MIQMLSTDVTIFVFLNFIKFEILVSFNISNVLEFFVSFLK